MERCFLFDNFWFGLVGFGFFKPMSPYVAQVEFKLDM
jgi:hypothetical protein